MKMNVLVLMKGPERFMFCYDDASTSEANRIFGQYAADPTLNFSWFDAAVLSGKVRELKKQNQ